MSEESTTPDLVALTRSMFEAPVGAWSQGAVVDTFTRFLALDVVWESVGLGTTFEGLAASREFLGVWMARFEDYEVDVEEILDLGNGVVFAKSGHAGRPISSPGHVRMPREVLVHSFVWEQGMITHVVSSGDTPEARADAERLAKERAMAEEGATPDLVELVRRFDEALNAHDFDALMSFYAPDAVASFGSFGSHEGRAAIRRFYEDFMGAFADFENRFEEIRDLGGGVAFVVFTQRGHPPGGTGWVQVRSGVALTLADGLIERQTNNVDIDEARAAAERLAEERG